MDSNLKTAYDASTSVSFAVAEVGFTDLQVEAPVLADAYGLADPADLNAHNYSVEQIHAPLMLIHGCRPDV